MEKLIWDCAGIMGLEEQFVPTAIGELWTSAELSGGSGPGQVVFEGLDSFTIDDFFSTYLIGAA
jgi:hypothetical protein